MRFFHKTVTVQVNEYLSKAKTFAHQVVPTIGTRGIYIDTNQSNIEKIKHDHYVSKVGEEAVKQVFQALGRKVKGPDYAVYEGSRKSWASDLYIDEVPLAVKTQSSAMAQKFGLSWTFQASSQRFDPILKSSDSWVCFVEFDEKFEKCYVYPPYQIGELKFGEPKLNKLKGTKKVVYGNTLPSIQESDIVAS